MIFSLICLFRIFQSLRSFCSRRRKTRFARRGAFLSAFGRRASNVERRTSNVERRTSNVERRTPSVERRASNAERRTPNAERRASNAERRTPSVERRTSNAERRTPNVKSSRSIGRFRRRSPQPRFADVPFLVRKRAAFRRDGGRVVWRRRRIAEKKFPRRFYSFSIFFRSSQVGKRVNRRFFARKAKILKKLFFRPLK